MGSTFGIIAITYGLPGVAICAASIAMIYARKNEKRIDENEKQQSKILANQKEMNRKLNVIGDHFMIKGMEK